MQVHLAVATALCMANMLEMRTTTTAVLSVAPIEVEEGTSFVSEVQTETVGAQVLVEPAMNVDCPHRAPKWLSMIQTFAKEPSRVRTAEQTSISRSPSNRSLVLSRTLFVGGVT